MSVPSGQSSYIDAFGVCKAVNNGEGMNEFVPSYSPEEWQSFRYNHPASAITYTCCPAADLSAQILQALPAGCSLTSSAVMPYQVVGQGGAVTYQCTGVDEFGTPTVATGSVPTSCQGQQGADDTGTWSPGSCTGATCDTTVMVPPATPPTVSACPPVPVISADGATYTNLPELLAFVRDHGTGTQLYPLPSSVGLEQINLSDGSNYYGIGPLPLPTTWSTDASQAYPEYASLPMMPIYIRYDVYDYGGSAYPVSGAPAGTIGAETAGAATCDGGLWRVLSAPSIAVPAGMGI